MEHSRIIENQEPYDGELLAIGVRPGPREELRRYFSCLPLVRLTVCPPTKRVRHFVRVTEFWVQIPGGTIRYVVAGVAQCQSVGSVRIQRSEVRFLPPAPAPMCEKVSRQA